MTGKHFVAAYIDQALHDKLQSVADALGMSKAALLRHLLRQGLASPVVLSTGKEPAPSD